jgi:hypothetical protein
MNYFGHYLRVFFYDFYNINTWNGKSNWKLIFNLFAGLTFNENIKLLLIDK